MDSQSPDDTLTFAKALHGWMGPSATSYAEERARTFRKTGDLPAAKAWARVATAIRGFSSTRSQRQATVLRSAGKV